MDSEGSDNKRQIIAFGNKEHTADKKTGVSVYWDLS